ncbi:MAG TPA: transporter substrate-binding domain-containing protein [Caldimonas sp.]|nr:transporter substrate-binding domain-containing protein [Caldimonas sp.]
MDVSLVRELAPTGKLRASLNLGNPVLARSRTVAESPAGVTIDLSRRLAQELGVELVFLEFATAAASVAALTSADADIGFMAIDPLRAATVHFTSAYVHIEGAYLVPDDSPIERNDDVDRPGVHVVVGTGSAYELHLSRTLRHAEIVKVATSEDVVGAMLERGLEVAAGVRQQLEADARRVAGMRMLEGRFMVIRQAMAMPVTRSAAAAAFLDDFAARMKAGGFVAAALARHGITGADVAP